MNFNLYKLSYSYTIDLSVSLSFLSINNPYTIAKLVIQCPALILMSHLWFSFWWNFLVDNPSLTRFLWLGHSWERLLPWRQSSASAISIGWAGKFCAYAHQLIMWSNTSKPPNWKSRKCKMLLIQLAQQHCLCFSSFSLWMHRSGEMRPPVTI